MGGLRRRLLGNQNLLAGRTMLALCLATVSGLVAAAIGAVAGLVAIGHTGLVIICTIFGIAFVCGLRFVIAAVFVSRLTIGCFIVRLGRCFFARRKRKNANKHDQRQRP